MTLLVFEMIFNYGISNLEPRTCELCNVMSNQKGKDGQKRSESRESTNR